ARPESRESQNPDIGSVVGVQRPGADFGRNNFEPAIIGLAKAGASQMEDALCGLRPICGNQILFLNGRSVLMMLMLVSPVPSEFAWAITFGRCMARFLKSLFRRGLPSYCVVWIARVFSPNVGDFYSVGCCLDRAPTPSGAI